jgi:hypothetical protein
MEESSTHSGYLGYYGLIDRWLNTFTEDEKKYIVERYKKYHPKAGPESLLNGSVFIMPGYEDKPSHYLNFLTSIFREPKENTIARKIAQKSLELAQNTHDLYWALMWTIILNYKARKSIPGTLDIAISACKRQIEIAPLIANQHKIKYPHVPLGHHVGYEQLVKILERQHNYFEVVRLSKEAKEQGWKGEWDKKIEKYQNKIA